MAKRDPLSRPRRGGGRALAALGDGLLLLCALLGLTWSFLSLYDVATYQRPMPVSFLPEGLLLCHTRSLTSLAVMLALAALLAWSLPRFRLAVCALLLAGWAGLVIWRREAVLQGGQLIVRAVADLLYERCGWGAPAGSAPDLSLAEIADGVTLFLAAALALLALALGWAVVRARRWWLAVALTLPPLLPGLLCDVYPSWPAFLLLAACWCAMLLTGLCRWAAPSGRGRLTLAVLPCVGAVLALLSLALPMEGYARPQWARDMEQALVSFGNRHLDFLSGWRGPFSGTSYVGGADSIDLSAAGPLRYTGRAVLKVTSDYTGRVYLRGTSLARYEDAQWLALADGAYDELGQALTVSPLLFPASHVTGAEAHTVTVENVGASGSCVYAPYQLAVQDWDGAGVLPVEDSYLARRRGEWTQTLTFLPGALDAFQPGSSSLRYTGAVDPSVMADQNRYALFVQEHYLDVPDALRGVFWSSDLFYSPSFSAALSYVLPDSATFDSDPIGVAQVVADLLDELCDYDPQAPLTPEGEDFVAYFLTESRSGYCMHFASAATLMLRSLGIPARYVSGFTAELVDGETVDVPDSAAHAWVEIYLEGYGWYPVEVTPSYEGPEDTEPASPSPSLAPRPSREPAASQAPEATPTPGQSAGVDGDGTSQTNGSALQLLRLLGTASAWLAGAAAVVGLVWLGQYLPKRRRARRLSAPDTGRAALEGYRCLTRLEKWGGKVPDQALDLARKARFSQHALTEEERDAMAALFDGQRARLARRLPWWKKPLFRYLWGIPTGPSPKEEETDHDQP